VGVTTYNRGNRMKVGREGRVARALYRDGESESGVVVTVTREGGKRTDIKKKGEGRGVESSSKKKDYSRIGISKFRKLV